VVDLPAVEEWIRMHADHLVFTDIEGSTRLLHELGEQA